MREQQEEEREQCEQLQHVMKCGPDPRVRRRAHALLLVGEGHTQASVSQMSQMSQMSHTWRSNNRCEARK